MSKKNTIICIVGESGCGKTTLMVDLCERYNVPYISSYTTREMRPGETDGVEHKFVRKEDVPSHDRMFAYTEFGGHEYWTTHEQIEKNPLVTYVIDEKGVEYMKNKLDPDKYDIVLVKVVRKDLSGISSARKDRDKDRIEIPDGEYNLIINNDGDPKDMTETLVDYMVYRFKNQNEYLRGRAPYVS